MSSREQIISMLFGKTPEAWHRLMESILLCTICLTPRNKIWSFSKPTNLASLTIRTHKARQGRKIVSSTSCTKPQWIALRAHMLHSPLRDLRRLSIEESKLSLSKKNGSRWMTCSAFSDPSSPIPPLRRCVVPSSYAIFRTSSVTSGTSTVECQNYSRAGLDVWCRRRG